MRFIISSLLDGCSFDFAKYKKAAFLISSTLLVVAFVFLETKGLSFGIDFTGGMVLEVYSEKSIDITQLRDDFSKNQSLPTASIHYLEDQKHIMIKVRSQDFQDGLTKMKSFLKPYNFRYDKIDCVGPQISKSLIYRSGLAIIFSVLAMFVYLFFRFTPAFALSGVLTTLHDIILLVCLYSAYELEFNTSSVAAVLAIVGYSINDSVVIFDKLRENIGIKNIAKRINVSVNTTLSRTVLTSVTTMLAIAPVAFLSSGDIRVFSLIILAGIAIGTYSSIFIAAPLALLGKNVHEVTHENS
ncbi:protein translocase subunit SecF [Neorickettsia risticii]|uniref:Protein-export membrane protein SecF n=1 Tax=Neorickettsia risticii (strain Illinois) TaxID=434131 RepID=C6V4R4_NEORI|nr:protein translocase subunit SecF [Neorickettsia risticii]ACT69381.1 protein-export membrane protein SecF [Neorickettsia risticii str. Illinois]